MWKSGLLNIDGVVYEWDAKVFDEGSRFGIDGGRVSKLEIRTYDKHEKPKLICNYDRGWDIRPQNETDQKATDAVLKMFGYIRVSL